MENGHNIRDFSEFCDQLNEIRLKFHKWDGCEKTVGLYYLMVGLPFANARFIQHALEQCISSVNTTEAQIVERNANDPLYISSFILESPQVALNLLLRHLPLLMPRNKEAADCYLRIIRQVLTELISPPLKIYNECVEIMSYVYIHPAFSSEEKKSFKQLLKQVLNKISPQNFISSSATESSDDSVSPNPDSQENFKQRRSNSLTVPQEINSIPNYENWCSQENLSEPPCKPRSYSLSSEKSLLAGITGLQSSRSETRLEDLKLMNNLPAMKSIISWLKSLRLHKYSWVFNNLTYSQMINLTEETLQDIGITKGARHKILLSINKLRERSTMLTELETEVMNGCDLNIALKKLKGVLQSPLQISLGEDLPLQFTKVMGKVCTQILMLRQPSDDYIMLFTSLCERAETMDAFTDDQKKRLNMWKCQLLEGDPVSNLNHRNQKISSSNRLMPENKNLTKMCTSIQNTYARKSSSFPNMKNNTPWTAHRHSVGSVTLQNQLFPMQNHPFVFGRVAPTTYTNCFNNVNDDVKIQSVGATQLKVKQDNLDIESSLESLCIQMMEHALGP
ncbi:unnamed protein product [Phaedon cochleariae]|uniref:SAM domain-containing protein n=1 Tax=Phaedon cochleariae TaxID=80249 RepID=A0A9N9SF45_PHACE|nr:unnamed protein product [Phaedon cochleariae]